MRLLFLTTAPPWPPRRGYQMRLDGLIAHLVEQHEIHILAQSPPGFRLGEPPPGVALRVCEHGRSRQWRGLLSTARLPIQVALHHATAFRERALAEIEKLRPDVVVGMLSRLGPVLLDLPVPTVVDLVDCLGLNMARRARQEPWLRPFWAWESRRMFAWERWVAQGVAATTVVSERDRSALLGEGCLKPDQAPIVVPLGLATDKPDVKIEERRPVVLLSGNLGYFPTVEGALWFARQVWPNIHAACPDFEFWLAGSRIAPALARLNGEPGIRLWSDPDDLRAIRRQARISIAPLRAGSGTPIKILEAMADDLPVVTTREGREGLDGLRGDEIQVAETAETFASAVLKLIDDTESARHQVEAARDWLVARHGLKEVGRVFEQVLERALRKSLAGNREAGSAVRS